jgi:hypothetical protein
VIPVGLGAGFLALCLLAVRELSARQAAAALQVPEQAAAK